MSRYIGGLVVSTCQSIHNSKSIKMGEVYMFILTVPVIAVSGFFTGLTSQPCSYDSRSRVANCSFKGLRSVPETLPREIETLFLTGNNITGIKSGQLEEYQNLKMLDLSRNNIVTLDKKSFIGLKRLQKMNLSHNMLNSTSVPNEVFSALESLWYLDIGNNQFDFDGHRLPGKSLSVLTNVKHLTIEGVLNLTLPEELSNMAALEELYFRPCKIYFLKNDTFKSIANLNVKLIDFGRCNIIKTDSAPFIPVSKSLAYLNMASHHRQDVTVPLKAVCGLRKMKRIHFSHYDVYGKTVKTSDLYCLSRICVQELLLVSLGITKFQQSSFRQFENPSCLKRLDLSNNCFSEIDFFMMASEVILVFDNLTYFDVSHSQYHGLSEEHESPSETEIAPSSHSKPITRAIYELTMPASLETLNFSDMNHNHAIWNIHFTNAIGLKTLNISTHQFDNCQGSIEGLGNLTSLDLSGLTCRSLNETFLHPFKSLRTLRMSNSNPRGALTNSLNKTIFRGLNVLEDIELSNNDLDEPLRDDMFVDQTQSLSRLNLAGNRFGEFLLDLGKYERLTDLDLQNNRLVKLHEFTRESIDHLYEKNGRFSLKLSDNAFICDCETLPFVEWIFTTKASLDKNGDYICILSNGQTTSTRAIYNKLFQMKTDCGYNTWLIIIIIISIIFLIILLIILICKYRFTLMLCYYRYVKRIPVPLSANDIKPYGATDSCDILYDRINSREPPS